MAHLFINNDAAYKEIFTPWQVFVFGGFALRANSIGCLEQVDSYAPGHQIRFGNLNYVADIRGDLVFDGFVALAATLCPRREHSSDPPSDPVQGSTSTQALALDPEVQNGYGLTETSPVVAARRPLCNVRGSTKLVSIYNKHLLSYLLAC